MANLKDLKNRIASVKSTQKITKAMQMVAAAKLRRAQDAAENARPYAEGMDDLMRSLAISALGVDNAPRLLTGTGEERTHLFVVMTAERGLCGAFNSSIVRLARRRISELEGSGKAVKILTVGRKGRDQLKREHSDKFVDHVDLSGVRRVGYEQAREIADTLISRFDEGEFDVASLFFNRFKSVISQIPSEQRVIPVALEEDAEPAFREYEPGRAEILRDLLPRGVATAVLAALLENAASEQGARMSAMDNATRNAGEMIDKLTIEYNRTRQAAITKELIEIISGAEAL